MVCMCAGVSRDPSLTQATSHRVRPERTQRYRRYRIHTHIYTHAYTYLHILWHTHASAYPCVPPSTYTHLPKKYTKTFHACLDELFQCACVLLLLPSHLLPHHILSHHHTMNTTTTVTIYIAATTITVTITIHHHHSPHHTTTICVTTPC